MRGRRSGRRIPSSFGRGDTGVGFFGVSVCRRTVCYWEHGNVPFGRYLFSQIRGVARAFAGSSGVPGGEAVSRLCVETDDFEDRSRMKRFGGQVAIGLSDGNVQGVSGGCRRFSHPDTRLLPRQEKPADIVPEEMAVISFGSQLHARRPGVVRFPTETGRPAVRWTLCVWQGAIISKGLLQAGPSICRAAVPVMAIPIFCR